MTVPGKALKIVVYKDVQVTDKTMQSFLKYLYFNLVIERFKL